MTKFHCALRTHVLLQNISPTALQLVFSLIHMRGFFCSATPRSCNKLRNLSTELHSFGVCLDQASKQAKKVFCSGFLKRI